MAAKREKRKEKRRKKKEEQRRKLEEIEAKNKENFELQAAQEKEKLKAEGDLHYLPYLGNMAVILFLILKMAFLVRT